MSEHGIFHAFDWLDDDPEFTRNTLIVLGRELYGDRFYEQMFTKLLDIITHKQEVKIVADIRREMEETLKK